MNPCTLMGGFWFEAGRCLFGLTVFAVLVGTLFGLFFMLLAIGSIRAHFAHKPGGNDGR